jgi:hypothetical protein
LKTWIISVILHLTYKHQYNINAVRKSNICQSQKPVKDSVQTMRNFRFGVNTPLFTRRISGILDSLAATDSEGQ